MDNKPSASTTDVCARKLLTREEAAAYMGVCKVTLDKTISNPDFPAVVRIGRRVFIHREKLDQWIDEKAGQ